MLSVHNLHFDYPERRLLHAVNFNVNAGELLHLRGANGAGKTTLLKLLAGLLHPETGYIQYDGQNITDDMQSYRQKFCYVGYKNGISPLLTVREHYQFAVQKNQTGLPFDELILRLSLVDQADVLCGLLSAGQRRRVSLMRLFVSDSLLWLLDEPLVALDQSGIDLLVSSFEQHLGVGGQVVITSHQSIPVHAKEYQEYCL